MTSHHLCQRLACAGVTIISAAFTANAASAQARPPSSEAGEGGWTYSLGTATENRSKGISKSDGEPYGWIRPEWENAAGTVHFGTRFEIDSGSSEFEASAGVRLPLGGFEVDVEVIRKWKLATDAQELSHEWNLAAKIDRTVGPVRGRLAVAISPDGLGAGPAWTWIEASTTVRLSHVVRASGAVGRREESESVDYDAWNVGLTLAATPSVSLDLRYYDTDAEAAGEKYRNAVVAAITVSF